MTISRRSWLRSCAALAAARLLTSESPATFGSDTFAANDQPLGLVIHSYSLRQGNPQRRFADPLSFLEHARDRGAAGVQVSIGERDEQYITNLREWMNEHPLYLEGVINLPQDQADVERFTREVRTAS